MQRSFPEIEFFPVQRMRREFRPETRRSSYLERDKVPTAKLANFVDNELVSVAEGADFVYLVMDRVAEFRPDRASFPRQGQYLKPCPSRVKRWTQRISELNKGSRQARIALSWRSVLSSATRDVHYLSIEDLKAFAALKNVEFWAFQPRIEEDEIAALRSFLPNLIVPEDLDTMDDFEGMVGFLSNMDFCVAPFTTNGELAGAIGTRTLLMSNYFNTAWRRNEDGSDVWHSNARVITGNPVGDRKSLVEATVAALREEIERKSQTNACASLQ